MPVLKNSESSGEDYYQTHAENNSHVLSNLSADISECGHLTASFSISYHLSLIETHPEYLCVLSDYIVQHDKSQKSHSIMHIPPQWLKTRKKEQKKQAPEGLS